MSLALSQLNSQPEMLEQIMIKINLQLLLKDHGSVKNKAWKIYLICRVQSDIRLVRLRRYVEFNFIGFDPSCTKPPIHWKNNGGEPRSRVCLPTRGSVKPCCQSQLKPHVGHLALDRISLGQS